VPRVIVRMYNGQEQGEAFSFVWLYRAGERFRRVCSFFLRFGRCLYYQVAYPSAMMDGK
jgi:hypothetical protein